MFGNEAKKEEESQVEDHGEVTASEAVSKAEQLKNDMQKLRSVDAQPKRIEPVRFELAEFGRSVYRAVTPLGDTIEDILQPDYWSHVWKRLRPLHRIEINPDDGSFYAELIVRSVQRNHVVVAAINFVELGEKIELPPEASAYRVEHAGPPEKFRVMRGQDVLRSKIETYEGAVNWLKAHLKSLDR